MSNKNIGLYDINNYVSLLCYDIIERYLTTLVYFRVLFWYTLVE